MRLKIELKKENCALPLNYQHLVQGMLYDAMVKDEFGRFYHDEGYRTEGKIFKMFTFSKLYGENTINVSKKEIVYRNEMIFYLSSEDEEFLQYFYEFFSRNKVLVLGKQIIGVSSVQVVDLRYFKGEKELTIKSCSPSIVCVTGKDGFTTYFKPSDERFEELVITNLKRKCYAIDAKPDISFRVLEVNNEKKRIMRFKNTSYEAYDFELKIRTNYFTLLILYNTGIGSKGSSGFGMIEVKNEKNILSL